MRTGAFHSTPSQLVVVTSKKRGEDREVGESLAHQFCQIAAAAVDDDAGGAAQLDAEGAHAPEEDVTVRAAQLRHHDVAWLRFFGSARVVAAVPVALGRERVDGGDQVGTRRQEAHCQRASGDALAGLRRTEPADVVGAVVAEGSPDILELHFTKAREVRVADRPLRAGGADHIHDRAVGGAVGAEVVRRGTSAAS